MLSKITLKRTAMVGLAALALGAAVFGSIEPASAHWFHGGWGWHGGWGYHGWGYFNRGYWGGYGGGVCPPGYHLGYYGGNCWPNY